MSSRGMGLFPEGQRSKCGDEGVIRLRREALDDVAERRGLITGKVQRDGFFRPE